MRFDFNVVVRGFDGKPLERPVYKTDENGVHLANERGDLLFERIEPVPLKSSLFDLLGARMRGDESIAGAELLGRYRVAQKIAAAGAGVTELDSDDVRVLLGVLEKGASPLVYGMTKSVLDKPAPETTP